MRNIPHRLRCLNTWYTVGGRVWEVWEERPYWKKHFTEDELPESTSSLFALLHVCSLQDGALSTLHQPPCHCLLPLFLALRDCYVSGTISSGKLFLLEIDLVMIFYHNRKKKKKKQGIKKLVPEPESGLSL